MTALLVTINVAPCKPLQAVFSVCMVPASDETAGPRPARAYQVALIESDGKASCKGDKAAITRVQGVGLTILHSQVAH